MASVKVNGLPCDKCGGAVRHTPNCGISPQDTQEFVSAAAERVMEQAKRQWTRTTIGKFTRKTGLTPETFVLECYKLEMKCRGCGREGAWVECMGFRCPDCQTPL